MKYDSRQDTKQHIERVALLLQQMISNISRRQADHDYSKLVEPEKSTFDEVTPKLRELTYGSDEYRAQLTHMKEALDHHYQMNRHHPEHFSEGVNDMTLIDVVEMLADWKAASERHADSNVYTSIEHNALRFGLSEQLRSILINTALEMGW